VTVGKTAGRYYNRVATFRTSSDRIGLCFSSTSTDLSKIMGTMEPRPLG